MLASLVGVALIAAVARQGMRQTQKAHLKQTLECVIRQCDMGLENADGTMRHVQIRKMVRKRYGYRVTVQLPVGYAASKFERFREVFEQATAAKIRIKRSNGRLLYLDVGLRELSEEMYYKEGLTALVIPERAPAVPLFTPFGIYDLNLWDDASCHLLIGGATRMGKSAFIRLLVTEIMLRLDGQVMFVLIDNKIEDLFPFQGIRNTVCAETEADAFLQLLKAKQEVKERRKKLKAAKDCVNMKQYREKHPEDQVLPLVVVVDEYARFAESPDIQDLVIELAETAGSLDVHVVIASQRPDAATVLRPRIKANLLARIAFTATDEANSAIIIGSPDAAHLGGIKGRAILLDGLLTTVQVPYITEAQTIALLDRFKESNDTAEEVAADGADDTRQAAPEVPGALPGFVTKADLGPDLPGGGESDQDGQ